jgi:hypothetical protein
MLGRLLRSTPCFGLERRLLTPVIQHCPEPRDAEEHSLQDEEDKSYVRGRIVYVMLWFSS